MRRRRMLSWIVFAVIAAGGVAMASVGAREWRLQRRALVFARRIEATVTKSEVREHVTANSDRRLLRDNSTTSYTADIAFEYEVAGVRYSSDRLRPSVIITGHGSRRAAAAELAPFPLGARVSAFVDDANPERAFLLNERSNGPIVFILVGLALIPIGWLAGRIV